MIVGHKDSGIDWDHPGFAGRIWINPGEDLNGDGNIDGGEINNVDDDGNGYVDDFRGWNFDDNNNNVAVAGITTLDQYGQVLAYLRGLELIESLDVGRVAGDNVEFNLRLRGDREQFTRALAARRVVRTRAVVSRGTGGPAYRLVAGP